MSSNSNFPCIISFQASDLSHQSVPICLAWSLTDGQYKSVSIIPQDDWVEGIDQGQFNIDDLFDFGSTAEDLIKELNQDCDKQILYSADPHWLNDVLNCLYSTTEQEHHFQIESVYDLFDDQDIQKINDQSRELAIEMGLNPHEPEDQIKMWLHLIDQSK
ncbi:MAG: hypothetical protein HRU38_09480 [Saccharospirillaceae bacterium]|nr:hypothetical protein [Pseudomonadales bacterium]NRB78885.1 hypothetical protein [Saccharospirillaceae bacterium]